ncbi:hypothetical protein EVAR_52944_1 [Eumeta japonica]|uniref:Uncharacterized protein n=1 Tax=Eumeta variegata TaxID=151549 RepID=A0A4C1XUG9_EUMVA|nr:hypothetical protein EVAR_52944_1 [Eumeta japonica]
MPVLNDTVTSSRPKTLKSDMTRHGTSYLTKLKLNLIGYFAHSEKRKPDVVHILTPVTPLISLIRLPKQIHQGTSTARSRRTQYTASLAAISDKKVIRTEVSQLKLRVNEPQFNMSAFAFELFYKIERLGLGHAGLNAAWELLMTVVPRNGGMIELKGILRVKTYEALKRPLTNSGNRLLARSQITSHHGVVGPEPNERASSSARDNSLGYVNPSCVSASVTEIDVEQYPGCPSVRRRRSSFFLSATIVQRSGLFASPLIASFVRIMSRCGLLIKRLSKSFLNHVSANDCACVDLLENPDPHPFYPCSMRYIEVTYLAVGMEETQLELARLHRINRLVQSFDCSKRSL